MLAGTARNRASAAGASIGLAPEHCHACADAGGRAPECAPWRAGRVPVPRSLIAFRCAHRSGAHRPPLPLPPCLPPSHAEFNKIATKTALGFVVMGFIGFFVKLIFIVSGWCCGGRSRGGAPGCLPYRVGGPCVKKTSTGRRRRLSGGDTTHTIFFFSAHPPPFFASTTTQPINQIIVGGSVAKD